MQTAFCSRAGRDETLQGFNTTSNGLEQKATVESLKIEKKRYPLSPSKMS